MRETVSGRGIRALFRLNVINANTFASLLIQPSSRKSFEGNSAKKSPEHRADPSVGWLWMCLARFMLIIYHVACVASVSVKQRANLSPCNSLLPNHTETLATQASYHATQ